MKSSLKQLLGLFLFLILSGTFPLEAKKVEREKPRLTSVQIIDRNGFSENVTGKDRLEGFDKINFLSSQPYQRVLRVYEPDQEGAIRSFITTYFENGQVKQYLEIKNSRAFGLYQEWYSHGELKVKTRVIGGLADITPVAQSQWLFEGPSLAYDEEGHVVAKINYKKGVLEGLSETFSPNGAVLSKAPYKNGLLDGELLFFSPQGKVLERHFFTDGLQNGASETYWADCDELATKETYEKGLLIEGQSFDPKGTLLHTVEGGEGTRLFLSLGKLKEEQEIHEGELRGEIKAYDEKGKINSIFHVRKGEKHGTETLYYPSGKEKISLDWVEGKIQGRVATWYPNGAKESEREFVKNQKQGLSLAWYPNGNLMLIESYDNDLLEKGEYFKKGDKSPVSSVVEGKGLATVYDKDGLLLQKVTYEHGKPLVP